MKVVDVLILSLNAAQICPPLLKDPTMQTVLVIHTNMDVALMASGLPEDQARYTHYFLF